MSELIEEENHIGLEFSRPGRLSIVEREAADFLKRVIDISRALDEKKKELPIRTDPYEHELPYELGPAASQGALSALERVAVSQDKKVIDLEITEWAAHVVAKLNEQQGQNEDKGLISRLAEAAIAKLNFPTGIF